MTMRKETTKHILKVSTDKEPKTLAEVSQLQIFVKKLHLAGQLHIKNKQNYQAGIKNASFELLEILMGKI